jgi:hypothetical protein
MAQDSAVEALLWEYREMRQELREVIASMNTNFQIGIPALTLVVGWGLTQDRRVLFIVPTLIFAFSMVHLLKLAATNILGTYCQMIAGRLRAKLGADNILMDWEGGQIWRHMTRPTSVIQCGFYLFFVPVAILFIVLSWEAFKFWRWSLVVHAFEFVAAVVYAYRAMTFVSVAKRERWMEAYHIETAEQPTAPYSEPAVRSPQG